LQTYSTTRSPRISIYISQVEAVSTSAIYTSLKTLNPSLWVTDEVINSFLLKVLHPSLRGNDTYFFNSFFFSSLLSTGSTGRNDPTYDFSAVSRWGNKLRRKGGVLGLKELFVPINHQNVNWLFLRVHMAEKTIDLWDPQGRKRCNQLYLQTMLMYLGDVYRAQTGQLADDWKSLWTLADASESAPKQYNGFDCGIFTLTNITLLAQHIPLHVQSYTEATFLLQDTRKRIALLLWKASRNRPKSGL
jgi:Ulp1 family protease